MTSEEIKKYDWRTPINNYLIHSTLTIETLITYQKQITIQNCPYMLNYNDTLIIEGPNDNKEHT